MMTMGPLEGLRIIETQDIGPEPFSTTMLADSGAVVIRVDRTDSAGGPSRTERCDLLAGGGVICCSKLMSALHRYCGLRRRPNILITRNAR